MARSSDLSPMLRKLEAVNKGIRAANSPQTKQRITKKTFEIVRDTVYDNVDARARSNSLAFHHLYEWGWSGDPSKRLFKVVSVGRGTDNFAMSYQFLHSSVPVPNSLNHVFWDKARVMELGISVTIAPTYADALVFYVDGGDTKVVTTKPVTVEQPGGDYVAGSLRKEFMMITRPSSIARNPRMKAMFEYEGRRIVEEAVKMK
jgi:hypothetical protein